MAPHGRVALWVDSFTDHFAPGEEGQCHYSNTGYVLLACVIERITGMPLDRCCRLAAETVLRDACLTTLPGSGVFA